MKATYTPPGCSRQRGGAGGEGRAPTPGPSSGHRGHPRKPYWLAPGAKSHCAITLRLFMHHRLRCETADPHCRRRVGAGTHSTSVKQPSEARRTGRFPERGLSCHSSAIASSGARAPSKCRRGWTAAFWAAGSAQSCRCPSAKHRVPNMRRRRARRCVPEGGWHATWALMRPRGVLTALAAPAHLSPMRRRMP